MIFYGLCALLLHASDDSSDIGKCPDVLFAGTDSAEVYAGGKSEIVMGEAIKVRHRFSCSIFVTHSLLPQFAAEPAFRGYLVCMRCRSWG